METGLLKIRDISPDYGFIFENIHYMHIVVMEIMHVSYQIGLLKFLCYLMTLKVILSTGSG